MIQLARPIAVIVTVAALSRVVTSNAMDRQVALMSSYETCEDWDSQFNQLLYSGSSCHYVVIRNNDPLIIHINSTSLSVTWSGAYAVIDSTFVTMSLEILSGGLDWMRLAR